MAEGVVEASVEIGASAERVWAMVADLPRMGEWSPENAGGRWLRGARGAAPGVKFKGRNRRGLRRWSTTCTIVVADPGREVTWDVDFWGLAVSRWTYALEALGADRCRLTERWTDRRGGLIRAGGSVLTGVSDRAAFTLESIRHTLAQLKTAAESGT